MENRDGLLSLVIPVFNEVECLPELMQRSTHALTRARAAWEIIIVNDGSGPVCSAILADYAKKNERIKVVNLSRNFGHQAAITAGLYTAKGEAVILMDGDLQDPPEIIPEIVAAWEKGADIVIAGRKSRSETGFRGLCFRLFHKIINHLSDFRIHANSGIFGLLSGQAVKELLRFNESNRFIPGLRSYLGFKTEFVYYDRTDRLAGQPKQTFSRLLKYGLDAVFSFSYKPLRLTLFLGFIVFFGAGGYAVTLLVLRLMDIEVVRGFTTTAVATLVLGGIQLISIGIMGEYIGRIYDEVKRRPMFIIRDTINVQ